MAIHWYRPFWVLGPQKGPVCSKTQWCTGEPPATETLAMSLTWGCPWLVSLGVLVLAFNIYTYVIF